MEPGPTGAGQGRLPRKGSELGERMSQRVWSWFILDFENPILGWSRKGPGISPRWLGFRQTRVLWEGTGAPRKATEPRTPFRRVLGTGLCPRPGELSLSSLPWTRRGNGRCRVPAENAQEQAEQFFPGPPSPGSCGDRRGRPQRGALTRVRVEIEAGHVLPRRQRAGQARSGQASGRSGAHAVAVHSQAGQQRRRGAVHRPRGPEVSAIHPPRECRSQPPTRPAGLAQWDLKVRPRRSPRVLGRRGLRGVHGGGGQRGLRSAAGPRPGAHRRPAVGPLRAARRSCARRRTRRLGRERRWAAEETGWGGRKKEGGGENKVSESRLAVRGRGLRIGWPGMKSGVTPFP